MDITSNPWVVGPAEILQYAKTLLKNDSDTKRRISMILTDNAVEQIIKTYFSLPKRITQVTITRNELQAISDSFPSLLDALEKYGEDKLEGIDLGIIEYYHRIRNSLYHEGFGLTVRKDQVKIYIELAEQLFENLFGSSLFEMEEDKKTLFSRFLELWGRFEVTMTQILKTIPNIKQKSVAFSTAIILLKEMNKISKNEYNTLLKLRNLRNQTVHGQKDPNKALTKQIINDLNEIVTALEKKRLKNP